MARRPLQEINAGSMADIAFLLLIFFLVTTTMSTNTGMQRKLPPPPDPKIKNDEAKVKERNVMVVLINKDNNIAIKGKPIQLKDICAKTKLFFTNPNNDKNLPEKKIKDIPFFGKYPVSKGIISLQTDRATNYGKYLKVNNELVRAIDELRDTKAMQKFGMKFDELGKVNKDEQKAVSQIYPLNISEAEPRRITAGAGK
ncbi:MAG: biopolymer transporter ExbD [Chlorobi bacterium]|nr:biopolymer transporter ExbD [Chlorobiota bacterium]